MDQPEWDLANLSETRKLVWSIKPDVIVNRAACTTVDKAESKPDQAYIINTVTPAVFGEEEKALGAWVVHYSTEYVFDGNKLGAYVEDDLTNPQSVHGRTKRDGEIAL